MQYFKEIAYDKCAALDLRERNSHMAFVSGQRDDDRVVIDSPQELSVGVYPTDRVVATIRIAYPEELPEKIRILLKSDNTNLEYRPVLHRNGVNLHLSLEESLIVLNTLATKHAEIRGGAWSGLGKSLELPLMLTLAKLFQVPRDFYSG
ncbi:MAG: hypothetical protein OXI62_07130, partial [Chloroflexota bacterium]|nr:hypothetical protein [Chloroflexota bacterium]